MDWYTELTPKSSSVPCPVEVCSPMRRGGSKFWCSYEATDQFIMIPGLWSVFFFVWEDPAVRSNVISHRWSARRFMMKIPAFAPCARASDKVPPGGAWRDKNGENLKQKPRIQTTDRVKCCLSWLKQRRVETCWHPNIIYLEQYVGKVIVNHGV